ncbi:hypothetical protein [Devosia sp.]|uniref:hypothetical protein n=1 Tax=Devosia sp. TaxID=1871048 RepID=UPI0032667B1C
MLSGEIAVLQAPMLDGLAFDPFALFGDGCGRLAVLADLHTGDRLDTVFRPCPSQGSDGPNRYGPAMQMPDRPMPLPERWSLSRHMQADYKIYSGPMMQPRRR